MEGSMRVYVRPARPAPVAPAACDRALPARVTCAQTNGLAEPSRSNWSATDPRPRSLDVPDQTTPGSDLQQKYRQFLDLLPLTISLAGLPPSENRLFSEEQIEARAITMRAAYRVARNTAKDCLSGS